MNGAQTPTLPQQHGGEAANSNTANSSSKTWLFYPTLLQQSHTVGVATGARIREMFDRAEHNHDHQHKQAQQPNSSGFLNRLNSPSMQNLSSASHHSYTTPQFYPKQKNHPSNLFSLDSSSYTADSIRRNNSDTIFSANDTTSTTTETIAHFSNDATSGAVTTAPNNNNNNSNPNNSDHVVNFNPKAAAINLKIIPSSQPAHYKIDKETLADLREKLAFLTDPGEAN